MSAANKHKTPSIQLDDPIRVNIASERARKCCTDIRTIHSQSFDANKMLYFSLILHFNKVINALAKNIIILFKIKIVKIYVFIRISVRENSVHVPSRPRTESQSIRVSVPQIRILRGSVVERG